MSNITGLQNLNVDEINCYSLNTNYISNNEINTLKGSNINLTLQSQINTLNQYVSNGSSGGGFFSISAGCPNGFVTTNPFWNFGGSGVTNTNIPLIFNFDFKVNSISFTCGSIPSTSATVLLYKNGVAVYTMPNINALTNTFYNMNVIFTAGDTLNIYTQSGAGGTSIKATISCSCNGVVGATPNLSIGSVTTLSSFSQPTVSISGNSLNPVLNFGLVQGNQGIQGNEGATGATGAQGQKGDKGDTGDSSAATAANSLAISGLVTTCLGLQTEIGGLQTEINGLQTEIGTIDDEILTLQGKTQYMTCNTATNTTNFASKLNTTGDITTNANISAIGYMNASNISGNATSTTLSSNSITNTTILGSNIYLGSFASVVYVNNVPLTPFSSASSFFNQW